ncbi:hypothetical protein HMI54_012869, partial [Coelomomyces lativittatus]
NDFKSRFEILPTSFVIQFDKELFEPGSYYLEFASNDIEPFLLIKEGVYFSQTPIPVYFVNKIICSDEKKLATFNKLWSFTDNDEIEINIQRFEGRNKPNPVVVDIDNESKERVLSFIKHMDKCLGAICFTKDLDPFIKYNFKGHPDLDDYSSMTTSRGFLHLLQKWMPPKSNKMFESLTSTISETDDKKGKLETDALAFRVRLFEKDLIKSPKQISLIGALYGYYTGYHNLRKYENNNLIEELDI